MTTRAKITKLKDKILITIGDEPISLDFVNENGDDNNIWYEYSGVLEKGKPAVPCVGICCHSLRWNITITSQPLVIAILALPMNKRMSAAIETVCEATSQVGFLTELIYKTSAINYDRGRLAAKSEIVQVLLKTLNN